MSLLYGWEERRLPFQQRKRKHPKYTKRRSLPVSKQAQGLKCIQYICILQLYIFHGPAAYTPPPEDRSRFSQPPLFRGTQQIRTHLFDPNLFSASSIHLHLLYFNSREKNSLQIYGANAALPRHYRAVFVPAKSSLYIPPRNAKSSMADMPGAYPGPARHSKGICI